MSENMDSPSFNAIIIKLSKIFPNKFVSISQNKVMDMKFRCSCKYVTLSTKLLSFINGNNLYSGSVH